MVWHYIQKEKEYSFLLHVIEITRMGFGSHGLHGWEGLVVTFQASAFSLTHEIGGFFAYLLG